MNSLSFLINTLFDLYIMVVILRIWLQAARADFYNPFSQFIVKATQPVVGPLRRVIPSIGSIDLATIVFAYVLCVLKFMALVLIASSGSVSFSADFLFLGLLSDQGCRRLVVLGLVDPRDPKLGQPRPQPNRIRVPSID